MATEPTFDQAGVDRPTSPGWYPDPDPAYRDGYERYWTGKGWKPAWTALDRRPARGRAALEVARPDPATPGWYPDPDPRKRDRYERYWDGEGWRPPWARRARVVAAPDGASMASPARVHVRYLLACMLPFALSLLVPIPVWRATPWSSSSSEFSAWAFGLMLAGWVPYFVGIAGKLVLGEVRGEAGAHEWRSGARGSEAKEGGQGKWSVRDLPGADDWRMGTTILAWILGIWGVMASLGLVMLMILGEVLGGGIGL